MQETKELKEIFIIEGGIPLEGKVQISGAKNSALPNMVASILTDEPVILENVPDLLDTRNMIEILNKIGISSHFEDGKLSLVFNKAPNPETDYKLVQKMRASILVLGALTARFGYAKVYMPGGCSIGYRPVDLHINALEKMGAKIEIDHGYITAKAPNGLKGTIIDFPKKTVTGTENIMMAATLAKGKTVIKNAAKEPEVVDLANLLIKMGAKISGAGTDTIIIEGVNKLQSARHTIIPDRIEAGTFVILSALTGGRIYIENYPKKYLTYFEKTLEEIGISVVPVNNKTVIVRRERDLKPTYVETREYPYFPTDLQAQMMVLLCFANGVSKIKENIFENRFMHVPELKRMGAKIDVDTKNQIATINKIDKLQGAIVKATDLRASAAMVIAGLVAEGTTVIEDIYHLRRGYENIESKLKNLGAKIKTEYKEN
ncbi:MAG: UDP-N-acetylglucosamine 1-carboxyvinyltransferase [Hydrogenothermus sp.]|nr:MAG: UDP-N-acetylglucosamine 1-carboxyvinyltransferase [Hydrogenothermus sp.]